MVPSLARLDHFFGAGSVAVAVAAVVGAIVVATMGFITACKCQPSIKGDMAVPLRQFT